MIVSRSRIGPSASYGIKKVNVGCGPKHIRDDWWNVDIVNFKGIDEQVNACLPWPWVDLEYVFCEHFIEHLELVEAQKFLEYARLALRIGGVIRISTPSLENVVLKYANEGLRSGDSRQALGVNRAFRGWGHKFLYSRELLSDLLRSLGYGSIQFCKYGESVHPALTNMERHKSGRSTRYGFPGLWIVEATKIVHCEAESETAFQELIFEEYIRYVGKH
jgi:predicted SAM-dependent methyltransferase